MGIRFRNGIKLGKFAKINIGKKSVGLSVGVKGAHHTINSSGRRTSSVGLSGTGLSYVHTHKKDENVTVRQNTNIQAPKIITKISKAVILISVIIILLAIILK